MNRNVPLSHRLFGIFLFGIAFGFIEAVIVVYLRQLYNVPDRLFPIDMNAYSRRSIEMIRELCTLALILGAAWPAGKNGLQRFAFYAIGFGTWDIFYYLGLKLFIHWPASLLTWDLLFLIPAPWAGPVLSPCLVSAALIGCGLFALRKMEAGYRYRPRWSHWLVWMISGALILATYLDTAGMVAGGGVPDRYRWWLFLIGLGLGLGVFFRVPAEKAGG
jgi:hypothetical protein